MTNGIRYPGVGELSEEAYEGICSLAEITSLRAELDAANKRAEAAEYLSTPIARELEELVITRQRDEALAWGEACITLLRCLNVVEIPKPPAALTDLQGRIWNEAMEAAASTFERVWPTSKCIGEISDAIRAMKKEPK